MNEPSAMPPATSVPFAMPTPPKPLELLLASPVAPAPDSPESVKARNVYVSELPMTFSDEHFRAMMQQFGTVVKSRMFTATRRVLRTGSAYGFCLYASPDDAERAIAGLNGLEVEGRRLEARPSDHGVVKEPMPPAPVLHQTVAVGRSGASGSTSYSGHAQAVMHPPGRFFPVTIGAPPPAPVLPIAQMVLSAATQPAFHEREPPQFSFVVPGQLHQHHQFAAYPPGTYFPAQPAELLPVPQVGTNAPLGPNAGPESLAPHPAWFAPPPTATSYFHSAAIPGQPQPQYFFGSRGP
jgi:hypothetical protein